MKNPILPIAVATTVASSVAVAAPITFKEKVNGAYNYTQYIETKMMTNAIDQELAALNTMYETSMFEETPFGDTATSSSSGDHDVGGLVLDPLSKTPPFN